MRKNTRLLIVFIFILGILLLSYLRYNDMIDNSDVISFIGGVFGALIGVWGALYIVEYDRKQEKERNIEKLMDMFKHTYMWVYPRCYIGASNSIGDLSEPIVPLIYDDRWKEYVIQIDNKHHKRFLLSWFYTLDSLEYKNEFIMKVREEQIEEAIKILKSYGLYDSEVKDLENKMKSHYIQATKDTIYNLKEKYNGIIDEWEEREEAIYEEQMDELEEEYSEIEILERQMSSIIGEFDKSIVNNSIYKF